MKYSGTSSTRPQTPAMRNTSLAKFTCDSDCGDGLTQDIAGRGTAVGLAGSERVVVGGFGRSGLRIATTGIPPRLQQGLCTHYGVAHSKERRVPALVRTLVGAQRRMNSDGQEALLQRFIEAKRRL